MSNTDILEAERLRQAERESLETGVEQWPNLVEMFFAIAERKADTPFLLRKSDNHWKAITYRQAAQTVADIATALRAEGLQPGARIVLVSENRPEFCLWDLGIMAAGGITVPTYTTNTARDHLHILENSGAVAAVVSTAKLAKTLLEAAFQSSHCRHVIGFEPLSNQQTSPQIELLHAESMLAKTKGDIATVRSWATMRRRDLACLIYTSGTGGVPRGVRQHHGAILHNVAGCVDVIANDFPQETEQEHFLSFLPLSHAYEHTAGQFLPIALGARIYYAESLEKLASNMAETSPSIMVVVPRLFEVLRARMVKEITKQGGLPAKLLDGALRISRIRHETGHIPFWQRPSNFIIERTLRQKVRARMGGRLKAMVSGGAPLNPEVGLFFDSIGLTLLQGYGQTEAAPVISCNRPAAKIKMHTVGPPLKDVEVRIADDGEILVSGELVMQGYWNNPEESARALTEDGWLKTGDIGIVDEDGHIVITDRKKDIIINDKGDNVAPQRVESMLTLQPEIAQAMVYGDMRPYLVGLVVPDAEFTREWSEQNHMTAAEAQRNPEFLRTIQASVDRVNLGISVIERVRRIILADEPFTVENEQMTPSLKIRRHILRQVYGQKLDALYKG